MKIQIRRGVFETNSSSMHSILIMKKRAEYTKQEIRGEFYLEAEWNKKKDVLHLDGYNNHFGRSFDVLTSFRDKLSYAIASYYGYCYSLADYIKAEKDFNEVFVPLLRELVGITEVEMPVNSEPFQIYADSIREDEDQPTETYEEVPHEDLVYVGEPWDDPYGEVCKSGRKQETLRFLVLDAGEIDHQSQGLLQAFMKKYGITLRDFLVRKDVVVVIDGDESYIFNQMKEAGVVDSNAIQVQYPKSGSFDWLRYVETHPEKFDKDGN